MGAIAGNLRQIPGFHGALSAILPRASQPLSAGPPRASRADEPAPRGPCSVRHVPSPASVAANRSRVQLSRETHPIPSSGPAMMRRQPSAEPWRLKDPEHERVTKSEQALARQATPMRLHITPETPVLVRCVRANTPRKSLDLRRPRVFGFCEGQGRETSRATRIRGNHFDDRRDRVDPR